MIEKLIFINSANRNRTLFPNANSFEIEIPQIFKVERFELVNFSCFNTSYAFTSTNNKIVWRQGVTTYTTTISPGTYTSSTFCSVLSTNMGIADAGHTYACSISSTTGKLTITINTSTFELVLSSAEFTMKNKIGFTTSADLIGLSSYTGDSFCDLSNTNYYFLNITQLPIQNNYNNFIIINNVQFGDTLLYRESDYKLSCSGLNDNFGRLTISLFDVNRSLIDLNGADFIFTLRCICNI